MSIPVARASATPEGASVAAGAGAPIPVAVASIPVAAAAPTEPSAGPIPVARASGNVVPIEELNERLRSVEGQLHELTHAPEQNAAPASDALAELARARSAHEARMRELDQKIAESEARTKKIEASIASIRDELARIEKLATQPVAVGISGLVTEPPAVIEPAASAAEPESAEPEGAEPAAPTDADAPVDPSAAPVAQRQPRKKSAQPAS